tara:strand:- start:443 stop:643 length:201 start_codon:yes stop_codon:yes gene_type:complete
MFFQFIFKKNLKKKIKSKDTLNDWMELSKEERQKIDFKEKTETMIKKKALLESIREEYKKIKKKQK